MSLAEELQIMVILANYGLLMKHDRILNFTVKTKGDRILILWCR
jgi:hypothetical protein